MSEPVQGGRARDGAAAADGEVVWELIGPDGEVKASGRTTNIITRVGDQMYGERGAGIGTAPASPTGMKLGTGATAVAKVDPGASLTTYLANSHQAFDATFPSTGLSPSNTRRITYQATWAPGKATSAGAITEAVIVNEALADATSAAAATVARVLLTGIGSKNAADTLKLSWTHDIGS